MTILLPTPGYHNGFAPRDADPRYPELWKGCVGAWCPLLGPTGTFLRDWSGFHNDANLQAMTASNAWKIWDGAYTFSPGSITNARFNIPHVGGNSLDLSGNTITLCGWLYQISSVNYPYTIHKSNSGQLSWLLGINNGNMVRFLINGVEANVSGVVTNGKWHHHAGVYDGTTMKIYVNGKLVKSISKTGNLILNNDPVRIGSLVWAGGPAYNGYLDDIRVYNRALSPSELVTLAKRRGIAYEPKPKRKYYFFPALPVDNTATVIVRPGKKGSYHDGFAPRDSAPLYPELWRGCIGAWCPSLGPTGDKLRDWSVYKNHGTLTSMDPNSAWTTAGGERVIKFDGVNDWISVPDILQSPSEYSISAWIYLTASPMNWDALFTGWGTRRALLCTMMATAKVRVYVYGAGDGWRYAESVSTLSLGMWYHVAGTVSTKEKTVDVFINGKREASTSWSLGSAIDYGSRPAAAQIGQYDANGYADWQFADLRLYDRVLSPQEIRLLSTRRGIAYESAPVKYYFPQAIITTNSSRSIKRSFTGSYHNGFAPRDGVSKYPELWKGCVGAWCPSLGPTGDKLRDWSGFARHGDLINTPSWVANDKYAIEFDGTSQYIAPQFTGGIGLLVGTGFERTLTAWMNINAIGARRAIFADWNASAIAESTILEIGATGKVVSFSRNPYITPAGATTVATGKWVHVAVTISQQAITVYYQGLADGSATIPGPSKANGTQIAIGRGGLWNNLYFNGYLDDLRIYNRALSPQEIKLLSKRRGIAYELEPVDIYSTYQLQRRAFRSIAFNP